MKKYIALIITVIFTTVRAVAQCSICTKTAQQLGEGPAAGLNSGIIYLAMAPLILIGYIGYRWWKNEKAKE